MWSIPVTGALAQASSHTPRHAHELSLYFQGEAGDWMRRMTASSDAERDEWVARLNSSAAFTEYAKGDRALPATLEDSLFLSERADADADAAAETKDKEDAEAAATASGAGAGAGADATENPDESRSADGADATPSDMHDRDGEEARSDPGLALSAAITTPSTVSSSTPTDEGGRNTDGTDGAGRSMDADASQTGTSVQQATADDDAEAESAGAAGSLGTKAVGSDAAIAGDVDDAGVTHDGMFSGYLQGEGCASHRCS